MTRHHGIGRDEMYVCVALLFCALAWLFMPVIHQPAESHQFADSRAFLGIPNAADVLSNLAFLFVGLLGLARLRQGSRPLTRAVRISMTIFFVGLFLTGFGSAYYHWNPTDATLAADRLPMTVAFAGIFGRARAERVSNRSGLIVALLMLVVGPASAF